MTNNTLFDIDVPLEVAIQFCNDEGLTNNFREKKDQFAINSPFINDNKRRCTIAKVNKDGAEFLAFNDFKARGNIDDDMYKGSFFKFVKLIKDFDSVDEAAFYIVTKYLREYSFEKRKVDKPTGKQIVSLENFKLFDLSIHSEYLKYLRTRGIDYTLLSKYKVYIDSKEKRIVFPVYEDGDCIFYNGRSILKWTPKGYRWKKSEVERNAYPLWNLENCKKECWLFEGIFDGIFWPDKACAYFGAIVTQELIDKIKAKNFERVVFFGQNPNVDKASYVNQIKIVERLKDNKINTAIFNWRDIKEKDLNEAIVNKTIEISKIEDRIIPWDDSARLLKELEML